MFRLVFVLLCAICLLLALPLSKNVRHLIDKIWYIGHIVLKILCLPLLYLLKELFHHQQQKRHQSHFHANDIKHGVGMSKQEAYEILGLQPGASSEAVQSAFKELIRKYHPDRGGSSYFSQKLVQARDLLLS